MEETPSTKKPSDEERDAARNAVRARRIGRLERRWWGRIAVNAFILWHAFALFIWLVPSGSATVQSCVGTVRPYLIATGFVQSWSMFSPNPDHMDVYLTADITYADGTKRTWEVPRMVHMSYPKRYEEERWRKMTEVVTHTGNPILWPALARYVARVNNRDPHNPPVRVALIEHSRNIPPPGQRIPPYEIVGMQTGGETYLLPIRPSDLR